MPIYEYACRACGERFELLQKHSDPPVTVCRSCSGPVEKLVSQTAFQLKGSGWYVTDYARKGKDKGAGTAGGKAERSADAGADAATKPDKAPAADKAEKADKPAGGEGGKPAEAAARPSAASPSASKE